MTALDDRAEALADRLHDAAMAATQLADARDEAAQQESCAGQLESGVTFPRRKEVGQRWATRQPGGDDGVQ